MKDLKQYKEEYLNQFKERPYGRNLLKTEDPFDAPTEECGIFGMYSAHDLDTFSLSQFGLFALQHRGQEACGISVMNQGKIINIKDEGLVLDVFAFSIFVGSISQSLASQSTKTGVAPA